MKKQGSTRNDLLTWHPPSSLISERKPTFLLCRALVVLGHLSRTFHHTPVPLCHLFLYGPRDHPSHLHMQTGKKKSFIQLEQVFPSLNQANLMQFYVNIVHFYMPVFLPSISPLSSVWRCVKSPFLSPFFSTIHPFFNCSAQYSTSLTRTLRSVLLSRRLG